MKTWLDQCWEPGFLAANLLRRNGLQAEPPCLSEEPHYRQPPAWQLPASRINPPENIRLHPNPARDRLYLELPGQASPAEARLYNMQGALVKRWRLEGGASPYTLNLSQQSPSPGIYLLEVRPAQGEFFRQKILLLH